MSISERVRSLRRPSPRSAVWGRYTQREIRRIHRFSSFYELVSLPFLTVFLLHNRRIHKGYRLSWRRKFRLAWRMYRTIHEVPTGTSNRAHLAMAAKILEIPPDRPGVLVEAGCWKGGTTANLSLVAEITGRDLIVYDSFEGLPPPAAGDRWASDLGAGAYKGELDEVRANVTRHGAIDRCQFRKGWFSDTLQHHTEPVVAMYLDVDHQASLHQCVVGLWPHLHDEGYVFIDEYTRLDYCALFFSETFWRTWFDRPPPGLMGAGTGAAVGQYFVGPYRTRPPIQEPRSFGWTRKDFYAAWDYRPDEVPTTPLAGGGPGAAHGPDGWFTTTVPTEDHNAALITRIMLQQAGLDEDGTEIPVADDPAEARARFEEAVLAKIIEDAAAQASDA